MSPNKNNFQKNQDIQGDQGNQAKLQVEIQKLNNKVLSLTTELGELKTTLSSQLLTIKQFKEAATRLNPPPPLQRVLTHR